jgi:hypothetical protein
MCGITTSPLTSQALLSPSKSENRGSNSSGKMIVSETTVISSQMLWVELGGVSKKNCKVCAIRK